jgi:hypothetical protein
MCPICITTAVLITSGMAGTGGLAAVAMWRFGGKTAAGNGLTQSTESGTRSDIAVQRDQQASEQYESEKKQHKSIEI